MPIEAFYDPDSDAYASSVPEAELEALFMDPSTAACLLALDVGATGAAAEDLEAALEKRMGDRHQVLLVTQMFVEPEHRGKGIGRLLVLSLLDKAQKEGLQQVWGYACSREPARTVAFWRSLGFETVHSCPWGCAVMVRELAPPSVVF